MNQPLPFQSLAAALATAPSRSALIAEAQKIQHVGEHWQREQAARIVKRRLAEFKQR